MEPDSISEIELLSRNYLSQNSNLHEYDDVDTTVLSPRRFPIGRVVGNGIVNVVTDDNEEEDNQTHSSGISSSTIHKTVQDIDGVLNEIRLRSSPDPDDFVFRSGNRQYYNGNYYDDDAMTEKSYLTNTNLFHELNRAHESFMDSGAAMPDDVSLLGKRSNNNDDDESVNDVVNGTAFDLSWLRRRAAANNAEYDKRRNRYDNSHIDNYENGHVYSPEKKHSHNVAHNEDNNNNNNNNNNSNNNSNYNSNNNSNSNSNSKNNINQEQNFDYWNEMPHSEEDLEEALSRVNKHHRRRRKQGSSTSFLGSKLISFLRRKRRDRRYQRQPQDQQQQQQQQQLQQQEQERPHSEELPASSSSSSKREIRLSCLATGCSTLAIAFVITGMVFMGTASSWSKFKEPQNSTFTVDTPSWMDVNQTIDMDSNSSSQINSSIIYIDVASEPTTDSPTILPIAPAPPNSTMSSVTTTNTTWASTEDPNTSLPPAPVSTVVPLPVSQTGSTIDVDSAASDSNPEPVRPAHGPLPISDVSATNINYVSSNLNTTESSSESQSQTVGNIPVSGGSSHNNNDDNNEVDTNTVTSGSHQPPLSPVFTDRAPTPDHNNDTNADTNTTTNANHHHQPEEEWIGYEPANFLPASNQRTPTNAHPQESSASNQHIPTSSPTKYDKKNAKDYRRNRKRRILNINGDVKKT
jgi:hypothetical protein